MDISKINLSKNQFHSEDFVMYETIEDKFCIMMNSDGNGTLGASSKTDIYQFDSTLFELGSTIAITTDYYSKKIFKDITKYIKTNSFIFTNICDIITHNVDFIYNEHNNYIHFCILITILDFVREKIYICDIGDCGYTLLDLDTKKMIHNEISNIKRLAFNGRGTALIGCPNSIHNNKIVEKETVNFRILDMPKKFVFLQYSDGLDYDIAIPITELEKRLKGTIDFDVYAFSNHNIVKYFLLLLKDKLKKDKPDTEFSRYNLSRNELRNIINKYGTSKDILTHIMKTYIRY